MGSLFDYFKLMIVVQLFFSVSVTMLAYALPSDATTQSQAAQDAAAAINMNDLSTKVEESIGSQTSMPLKDLGALVFYSGNMILDLLLNFFMAVPIMLGLIVNSFCMMFNIDDFLVAQVQLFATVTISVLYLVSLAQTLLTIRSRGSIV